MARIKLGVHEAVAAARPRGRASGYSTGRDAGARPERQPLLLENVLASNLCHMARMRRAKEVAPKRAASTLATVPRSS